LGLPLGRPAGSAILGVAQLPAHGGGEPGEVVLGDVVVRTGPHHRDRGLLARRTRHDQEGQVRVGGPDDPEAGFGIEPGEGVVRQDDLPWPGGQSRPQPSGRHDRLPRRVETALSEGEGDQFGVVG
jgi:hypothetical protein